MQQTLGNSLGSDIRSIKKQPLSNNKVRKNINRLLWAIKGPIIVMPGYTDMSISDNIKNRITIERLCLVGKRIDMASDTEAMWYISTASLAAPLSRDWSDIFLYLSRNHIKSQNIGIPDFLKDVPSTLNDMQISDLKRLKEWLYKRSFEEIKQKIKKNKIEPDHHRNTNNEKGGANGR